MPETILPERVGLIYERSLDVSGLENPGTAIASMIGFSMGPADFRSEAVGFPTGGTTQHPPPNTTQFNGEGQDGIHVVSAAGASGINFASTNIPLWRQRVIFPVSYRTRRTYVWEAVVNIVLGPAATRATVGIHANLNDLVGSTGYGVEWSAGSGENGGRWTVRYRRTGAPTVVTNVADSGIAANATPRRLAIVFRENDIAVDFFLDSTLVTTITDPLAICGVPGNTVANMLPVIATGAGAAGTNMTILAARLRVYSPDAMLYPSDFASLYPHP